MSGSLSLSPPSTRTTAPSGPSTSSMPTMSFNRWISEILFKRLQREPGVLCRRFTLPDVVQKLPVGAELVGFAKEGRGGLIFATVVRTDTCLESGDGGRLVVLLPGRTGVRLEWHIRAWWIGIAYIVPRGLKTDFERAATAAAFYFG
jgi:hypothetical protein